MTDRPTDRATNGRTGGARGKLHLHPIIVGVCLSYTCFHVREVAHEGGHPVTREHVEDIQVLHRLLVHHDLGHNRASLYSNAGKLLNRNGGLLTSLSANFFFPTSFSVPSK